MFKPQLTLRDYRGGINTGENQDKIKNNQFRSLIGFDFDNNSIRRALGFTKLGTESNDSLTGKNLYTHQYLGTLEKMVKPIGTFLKFYDEVDGAWYKITATAFTTSLDWTFESFNGYMYGDNGTDDWVFWNGSAHTTLDGAITTGSTTIDLLDASNIEASGTIMIEDDQITYSGKSTNQLTGVTGISADHADGKTVIQELDTTTYAGLDNANQIKFFKNRNYVIDASSPNIVRHSKLADNTNPETDLVNFTVAGSGSGDAGFGIAPAEIIALEILVITGSDSVLIAFCKDGIAYKFVVSDGTSTTTNSFIPIRPMGVYPVNRRMVAVMENDIAFVDNFGHVRTLFYGDVETPVNVGSISEAIEPSLEDVTWTNGDMRYHKRKLYVTGQTSNAVLNDITFIWDVKYKAWASYTHWDVISTTEYNDKMYGYSTIKGDVYEMNVSYNSNDGQYFSEAVSKKFDFGEPLNYKAMIKMRIKGFITSNCNTYIDFFIDGQTNPEFTFLINGDNSDIIGSPSNVACGSIVFGQGVFGGGLPSGTVRKDFRAELQLNAVSPFLDFYYKIRIDETDIDFEMGDLEIWSKMLSSNLWLKNKVLSKN